MARRAERLAIDASRATVDARSGTEWYSLELIRALAALPDCPPLTLYLRDARGADVLPANARRSLVRPRRLWTHAGSRYLCCVIDRRRYSCRRTSSRSCIRALQL